MKIYCASNEIGLFFIETDNNRLDPIEKSADGFRLYNYPELESYALMFNISGYLWLDVKYEYNPKYGCKITRFEIPWEGGKS